MSKLNIDFILIDESVVMHGFRALMSGAQIDTFKQNPLMLLMHGRAEPGYLKPLDENVVLPIGKWYDIRIEGDKLLAKPEFDDDDDFAKKIESKVKKGYLNAASICLEPIAVSEEESLKITGQRGPTITKWGVMEASIVDIPNCRNALAIRNSAGKTLALSGNGDNTEATNYLKSLVPAKETAPESRVLTLVNDAIRSGKISATERQNFINLAVVDFQTTKGIIDRLQPSEMATLSQNIELQELLRLSGRELYLQGKFEKLKALSPSHFRLKYKEFSGKEYPYNDVKANPELESHLSAHNSHNTELVELLRLSGRELYLQGKFERLKALSLKDFQLKHKEYWGTDYQLN